MVTLELLVLTCVLAGQPVEASSAAANDAALSKPAVTGQTATSPRTPAQFRAAVQATLKAAATQLRTVARPMSLNAYKIDLAQGLIERTILEALG